MEDDVANLDESFKVRSPPRNPFIDYEAAEATDAEGPEDDEENSPTPMTAWESRNSRKI